jgi:hypothetical protein
LLNTKEIGHASKSTIKQIQRCIFDKKNGKKKERSGDRSNRLKSIGHSPTKNRIKSQTFDYNTFYIIVSCQKSNFIKQKTQPPL